MRSNFGSSNRIIRALSLCSLLAVHATAQSAAQYPKESDGGFWFSLVLILFVIAGGAFYFWRMRNGGKSSEIAEYNYDRGYSSNGTYEMTSIDADQDLEWLRKAKRAAKPSKSGGTAAVKDNVVVDAATSHSFIDLDTRAYQEKMRKLQYSQLPINSFIDLRTSKRCEPLPISSDPSLLNAIEQANEEFEEDESVRDLAVRILTAFRNRNSVDALSQLALYDLSSNLRSKAVSTLTDFDHPSVFESILLACADPTREVRAAAARGLFRLSFDRADAWKRIMETNDEYRINQAARAAVESGILAKSLDRLIHEDLKIAYEAFALVCLIIKSGETDVIFKAIKNQKDDRVKFALIHVLKVQKDERTLEELEKLNSETSHSTAVVERINEAVSSFEQVVA